MMCFTTSSECQLVLLWHGEKQHLSTTVPARSHRCSVQLGQGHVLEFLRGYVKEQDKCVCVLMFWSEVNRPSTQTEHASQKKSVSSRVLHTLEGLSEESSGQ